jgi:FkbM family methyltransferase
LRLRNDFDDLMAMRNVFFANEYHLAEPAPKGGPDPEKWVIDIGAHIGTFSLLAVMLGYKKVAGFEPQQDNFGLMSENLASLSRSKGVQVARWQLAVMPPGIVTASLKQHKDGRTMMWSAAMDDEGDVSAVGLDWAFRTHPVGVCKIDIEGGEFELIRTCPDDELRKPDEWLIECHPHAGDPDEIRRRMYEAGYAVEAFPDPHHTAGNTHIVASRLRVLASTPGVK